MQNTIAILLIASLTHSLSANSTYENIIEWNEPEIEKTATDKARPVLDLHWELRCINVTKLSVACLIYCRTSQMKKKIWFRMLYVAKYTESRDCAIKPTIVDAKVAVWICCRRWFAWNVKSAKTCAYFPSNQFHTTTISVVVIAAASSFHFSSAWMCTISIQVAKINKQRIFLLFCSVESWIVDLLTYKEVSEKGVMERSFSKKTIHPKKMDPFIMLTIW